MSHDEEPPKAAKERVHLQHVETKKQSVDKEKLLAALNFKHTLDDQQKTLHQQEALTPEDLAVLTAFEKSRMLLDRIWITTNQARAQTGKDPIKRDDLKEKLARLVNLGYLTHDRVKYEKEENDVYILTEKGQELTQ